MHTKGEGRGEGPERNPHTDTERTFDERQDLPMGNRRSFQQTKVGKLHLHTQRRRLHPHLTAHTETNPKWTKDPNVRPTALRPLEQNKGQKLHNTGLAMISCCDQENKVAFTKTLKFLCVRRHCLQSRKATRSLRKGSIKLTSGSN